MHVKARFNLVAGSALLGFAYASAHAQPRNDTVAAFAAGDWWTINRDAAATRYAPLDEIDTTNVASLAEAWTYALAGGSTAVPLVVGGVMYLPNGGSVVALDGATGEAIWSHALSGSGGRRATASTRGVSYWPGDGERTPRILLTSGANLVALDAATGEPVPEFGTNGLVAMGVGYGGTPTIYRHVAIVGASVVEVPSGPAGNTRAFDVRTGEKLWEFASVAQPGQPGHETWLDDGWEGLSGTNMWAFAAPVDAERGIVYVPLSSPAPNYYGGARPGANAYGNSIVAIDAVSGEYRWHFQTVHHDLWDSDMPSAGALFDVVVNGERTPAIGHVGKTSYFFVLDRATGKPLIDVEERPVPQGDVPGEWYSPTQPFPVRPEPLSRVSFDVETDLVRAEDTTPEHVAACRELIERSGGMRNEGPFTPFLFKAADAPPRSTVQLPGGTGGVNWGGIAVDLESGYAFANAQSGALIGWVEEKVPGGNYGRGTQGSDQRYDRASIGGPGPYANFNAPLGGYDESGRGVGPSLPCYRPPWAELVAVDTNRGAIVWSVPLGLNTALPEGKQLVGGSGSAGPTVTAGGLVFVGATGDGRFRAFDARTGEELWSAELGAQGNANPMSYTSRAGKQHIAIVAGNRVAVYALP
jgi:quinoprotein glucose dehydrogenase